MPSIRRESATSADPAGPRGSHKRNNPLASATSASWGAFSFSFVRHGWHGPSRPGASQKTADEDTPAMDVTTDRTHSDGSASGHLPSVAIRPPQDRVHVE